MDQDNHASCFREESGQSGGTYSAWQEVLKEGRVLRLNLKTRKSIPVSEPVFQGNHKINIWRIPHLVLKELSGHINKVKPIGFQKRGGRNEISRIWTDKKISYILPTHHHQDHFGGIRPICKKGVSVITTHRNPKLAQSLCPLRSVIPVKESLVLGNGEKVLIIYTFKTLHSDEILIASSPGSKSVFEADLSDYVLTSKQFLNFMEKKRLVVDRIFGSHNSGVTPLVIWRKTNLIIKFLI